MKFLGLVLGALLAAGCTGCATHSGGLIGLPSTDTLNSWAYLNISEPNIPGGSGGSVCVVGQFGSNKIGLTAKHVVEDITDVSIKNWVSLHGNGTFSIGWVSPGFDLATVVLHGENSLVVAPIRTTPLLIGEEVTLDGVITDVTTVFHGRILGARSDGMLFIDSMVWPGSSGGCVKDKWGKVVAITLGTMFDVENPSHHLSAGRAQLLAGVDLPIPPSVTEGGAEK